MIQAEPITAKELFESMVEVPVDNTCRTCKFWKSGENGYEKDWGICHNIDSTEKTSRNDWGEVAHANDFGCIFHEPKKVQNAR